MAVASLKAMGGKGSRKIKWDAFVPKQQLDESKLSPEAREIRKQLKSLDQLLIIARARNGKIGPKVHEKRQAAKKLYAQLVGEEYLEDNPLED